MLLCLVAFLGGLQSFVSWLKIAGERNFPIVAGRVLERTPCKDWGVPSVDFTIEVVGEHAHVHSITGKYLMTRVPEIVRFHYSGNPERKVFLFEYAENPLWIWLFCWSLGVFFLMLFSKKRE